MGELLQSFEIMRISFAEILPFWKDQLWPGRLTPIEPASAIAPDGKIGLDIFRLKPFFYAARVTHDDQFKLVGVNSGFQTSATHLRSRGIWVDPAYRGRGIGFALLDAIEKEAAALACTTLWTMPRQAALLFYEKFGFVSKLRVEGYEFGPHQIAEKNVGGRCR